MAQAGDQRAFQELFHRHSRAVYARLTRTLGTVTDREDQLQHVFLRLHRALPHFRGDSSLRTFLYTITSRVSIDYLRARRRQPLTTSEEEALGELASNITTPAERVSATERLKLMYALLATLKVKRRIAFTLVAIEGLSFEEAALQLNVSPAAVRQRYDQAKRQLRELLERREREAANPHWSPA
ncbi:MAG: RNA polymerase sigma factor [Kofleriaceae bacterium]